MKKLRIFFMIILSIILIVLCGKNAESYPGDGELWISPWYGSSGAVYYNITAATPEKYDNVYCIKKGYALMTKSGSHPYCYCMTARVEMDGDEITFEKYDKKGNRTSSKSRKRVEADYVLAAILCHGSDLGMWSYLDYNTSSQLALFEYWNTWVSQSGSGYFPTGGGSGGGSASYASVAESRAYNLTIELYQPESSGYQNVIIVHRDGYDKRVPPTIDIGVSKSWSDSDNTYGNRPNSITVNLYRNGSNTGKSLTLNSSNGWSGTFTGLDSGTGYSVQEESVPVGYTASYGGSQSSGFTITNTLQTTSIKVEKTWSDLENCYDLRPTSVKLQLMRQRVDQSASAELVKEVEVKKTESWKKTISDLPLYVNGYEMKYWVEETDPEYYTHNINYNASTNTYEILNTLDKVDIKVTKKWEDENNHYNNRPQSVRVYLYMDNVKQKDKYIDLKTPDWAGTFTGLEPVKGYTVKEEVPAGYTASITGTVKDGFIITNTLERTSVSVEKIWDDENNALKLRPATINVSLWQNVNGVESEFTNEDGEHLYKTLQGTNKKYPVKDTYTNLPKYIDGVQVYYSVREEDDENPGLFDNYMLKDEPIPYDQETNSFIITNVLSYDGYKEIKGRVWVDGESGKANDIDGKFDVTKDTVLKGIKVTLRDEYGNQFDPTSTTTTDENGEYIIKVNYDKSGEVYKLHKNVDDVNGVEGVETKLKKAYVEFEYDGMLYTTISNIGTESIVEEVASEREWLDGEYSTVTEESQKLEKIMNDKNIPTEIKPEDENRLITARTKVMGTNEFINATTIKEWEADETTLYCKGSGKYIRTNTTGAWLEPVQGTCSNCQGKEHTRITKIDVQTIENVNCALFVREQPDVAIFSDLTEVKVRMREQEYTYLYGVRSNKYDPEDADYLQVKFQDKDTYTYRRPVNPADIAYVKDGHSGAMEVYVTYQIKVANLSTTLITTVNEIINAYDKAYEIKEAIIGDKVKTFVTTTEKDVYNSNEEFQTSKLSGFNITLQPLTEAKNDDTHNEVITITYKVVDESAITGLLTDKATLNNAVEIGSYSTAYGSSTLYAEQRTHQKDETDKNPNTIGRAGKIYAGYDDNSHPGNANIELRLDNDEPRLKSTETEALDTDKIVEPPEDDTDFAPSFVLVKDPDGTKTLSGTIWEDGNEGTNGHRLGDGQYITPEKGVENVKVELYEIIRDENKVITAVNLAKLYEYNEQNKKVETEDAIRWSSYNEQIGTVEYALEGVVTGEYFIKYTYGNNTEAKNIVNGQERVELEHVTAIKGETEEKNTEINARNYKSTIIKDPKIRDVMSKNYGDEDFDKKWHINHEDGFSVAVDNMKDRLDIDDLIFGNYNIGENMTAYTKPFETQVEFEATGSSNIEVTDKEKEEKDILGNIGVSETLNKLDFGIIERPQEDLFVQKTITHFKITLANGQVLTEGNPSDPNANINYAKPMGFSKEIKSGQDAKDALEKILYVEIDAELMQGAQLEVTYAVTVTNNNEIDYDYETDYYDIESDIVDKVYDKYITKLDKAKYYYFGESGGLDLIKAKIQFIDYLNKDLVYKEDRTKWTSIEGNQIDDLYTNGYISEEVYNALKNNRYEVLQNASGAVITLGRGEPPAVLSMTTNKLLANQDDNVFDNNAEIISIDHKTARTVKANGGEYEPGNYIPGVTTHAESQTDDDKVEIKITPPTGATNYITTYVIAALSGLIIVLAGVIFIKKKILIK